MLILSLESSCDETSAAIVKDGQRVHANIISSSIKDMKQFGGVVPEIAARKQLEYIIPVIHSTLEQANIQPKQIDAIAVTKGPGLLTSLLVGTSAARAYARAWQKPLIGVHHTLGHLSSPWINVDAIIPFPVLTLSVSGGHTELWFREKHTQGQLLGRTRDDAAGEAFDKGATQLLLPYPGGPAISQSAEGGNPFFIEFPRPLLGEKTCDFSYSGLKTALKYTLRDRGGIDALDEVERKDVAASYEYAICDHLITRLENALNTHPEAQEIHLVGGVACNKTLRSMITERIPHILCRFPEPIYCTDNAAMIGVAAFFMTDELGKKAYENFETEASVKLELR